MSEELAKGEHNYKKERVGVVVSDKMNKTRVVEITRMEQSSFTSSMGLWVLVVIR